MVVVVMEVMKDYLEDGVMEVMEVEVMEETMDYLMVGLEVEVRVD